MSPGNHIIGACDFLSLKHTKWKDFLAQIPQRTVEHGYLVKKNTCTHLNNEVEMMWWEFFFHRFRSFHFVNKCQGREECPHVQTLYRRCQSSVFFLFTAFPNKKLKHWERPQKTLHNCKSSWKSSSHIISLNNEWPRSPVCTIHSRWNHPKPSLHFYKRYPLLSVRTEGDATVSCVDALTDILFWPAQYLVSASTA